MADIKINGSTPSGFYYGGAAASAVYYGATKLWEATPVLPANTIRCKFTSGYTPAMGDSQTLVDASENIWDIYKSGGDWSYLFSSDTQLEEVIAANTTGVDGMCFMFFECTSLTSVPLFDISSVTNTKAMFSDCTNLVSVPLFDTSSVTNMDAMFCECRSLTSVPLFDTSSVTNMNYMFNNCYAVESGALALYQQTSTQANPPTYYEDTFTNCGRDTASGAAELSQIPSSWGGTGT